jgi:hypothetical protein
MVASLLDAEISPQAANQKAASLDRQSDILGVDACHFILDQPSRSRAVDIYQRLPNLWLG